MKKTSVFSLVFASPFFFLKTSFFSSVLLSTLKIEKLDAFFFGENQRNGREFVDGGGGEKKKEKHHRFFFFVFFLFFFYENEECYHREKDDDDEEFLVHLCRRETKRWMHVSKRDDDDSDDDEKKKSDEIVPNLLDVHPDGRRETHKPDFIRVLFFRSKRWWRLPVRGNRTKMAKELARKQNLPNAFVKLWLRPIETEILRVGYVPVPIWSWVTRWTPGRVHGHGYYGEI